MHKVSLQRNQLYSFYRPIPSFTHIERSSEIDKCIRFEYTIHIPYTHTAHARILRTSARDEATLAVHFLLLLILLLGR